MVAILLALKPERSNTKIFEQALDLATTMLYNHATIFRYLNVFCSAVANSKAKLQITPCPLGSIFVPFSITKSKRAFSQGP